MQSVSQSAIPRCTHIACVEAVANSPSIICVPAASCMLPALRDMFCACLQGMQLFTFFENIVMTCQWTMSNEVHWWHVLPLSFQLVCAFVSAALVYQKYVQHCERTKLSRLLLASGVLVSPSGRHFSLRVSFYASRGFPTTISLCYFVEPFWIHLNFPNSLQL